MEKNTSEDEIEETSRTDHGNTNLKKDYKNIAFLMLLYILQGLPMGLCSSVTYILVQKRFYFK
jgi:hypothetical protein